MSGLVLTSQLAGETRADGDTVLEAALVNPEFHAEPMTNRMLRCLVGTSLPRRNDQDDTYLFVIEGEGTITVGGAEHEVARGSAVLVPARTTWQATVSTGELLVSDTAVPAAPLPYAETMARGTDALQPVVRLGEAAREAATASREFEVLYGPSRGSAGATQFVGFIPTSGAPEHYHLYDEICCIVRGKGILHAGGESIEIGTGSTFHVPPRFLHAVENTEKEDMWILGVFRPPGSAAAAYYPDGRPAENNQPEMT